MTPFKLTPIGAAVLLMIVGSSPASAQSAAAPAAAEPLQTIQVTGLRRSIRTGEEIKRDAIQVVDSINADDIGKFPDRSIGDALQRVAGVQVARDLGETNKVIIRGLPDVATSINGNEMFTAVGRRISPQDLPVQSVAGLDVYKSASVNQVEGGMAGAIDIRLRSPMDFAPGSTTAAAYVAARRSETEGSRNSPAKNNPGAGALVGKRWKNDAGEFGILLDATIAKDHWGYPVQWNDQPDRLFSVGTDGKATRLQDDQPIAPLKAGDRLGNLPHIGGIYNMGDRERSSVHSSFQWKVNNKLDFTAHVLSLGYKGRSETDYLFSIVGWAPELTGVTLAPDGAYCKTKIGNICPILAATAPPTTWDPYTATSTQARKDNSKTNYFSLALQYKDGPLKVTSNAAFTRSRYSSDLIIVDQQVPNATATVYTNDASGHGGFTSITTPTSSNPLADPNQFVLRGLVQTWNEDKGSQAQWRTDVDYKLGGSLLEGIAGGVRLSSRDASSDSLDRFTETPNGERRRPNDVFGAGFENTVPGIDRLGGPFSTPSRDFLLDKTDVVRAYYGRGPGRLAADPNRSFDQTERTSSAYLAARLRTELAGIDIKANLGARVINVKRELNGKSQIGNVVSDIKLKTSETNVLPNLSAVVGWRDNVQSHFSIGKTISRPDFASLNPALSLTPPTVNAPGSGGSGNPELKPIESINADATLEYYFAKNGFLQLALFNRRIDGYLINIRNDEVIDGLTYRIDRPQNSAKGLLRGAELGFQRFFDSLPPALQGFGLQANYTYITGHNETPTGFNSGKFTRTALQNVAPHNYNVALLYEKHGLTGRLAATHRGEYLEMPNASRFGLDHMVKAATYVDLSLNFNINKHVNIQFDALNLTKAKYESYLGDPIRPRDVRYSPTAFGVALHFKL
ncbi:MAG: TonB-dependent receptor [Pseudomonadota bacterium]